MKPLTIVSSILLQIPLSGSVLQKRRRPHPRSLGGLHGVRVHRGPSSWGIYCRVGCFSNAIQFLQRIWSLALVQGKVSWAVRPRRFGPVQSPPQISSEASLERIRCCPTRGEHFTRDHKLFPRKAHNERGEQPVFDMSPAKPLLRQDTKDEMHLHYKTSKNLQLSRLEYKPFKPRIFHNRILQEIRLQKYIHYLYA